MNIYDAIIAVALDSVTNEPADYIQRRVRRWYSKTFHTPLAEVDDMPLEPLLVHFYEETFESMEPEQLEAERIRLIESDEERAKRLAEEDVEEFQNQELMKMLEKNRADRQVAGIKEETPRIPTMAVPEPSLVGPTLTHIPEGIQMSFADADTFEALMEGSAFDPPVKK